MGYVFVVGNCHTCGGLFCYNPHYVPSIRDDKNQRQPICYNCIQAANKMKEERGLPPIIPHKDAYELLDEREL
jgi:hypothetical protein